MLQRFVCIGIYYQHDLPNFRILTLDAESEATAKAACTSVGNVPGTTTAWTGDAWCALANEVITDRADFVVMPTGVAKSGR